ncbi:hypothetical protein ACFWWT_30225 [Streptomyces sp. NPDC058676]|uniref:hypothetical protein n=1 Tax=unclassified Streptomyces TaxID=2593676 RepID=UPI0036662213
MTAGGCFDRLHRILPAELNTTGAHHLLGDGRGTPLKVITTAANINDVTATLALADGTPPAAGRPSRSRRRTEALLGGTAAA